MSQEFDSNINNSVSTETYDGAAEELTSAYVSNLSNKNLLDSSESTLTSNVPDCFQGYSYTEESETLHDNSALLHSDDGNNNSPQLNYNYLDSVEVSQEDNRLEGQNLDGQIINQMSNADELDHEGLTSHTMSPELNGDEHYVINNHAYDPTNDICGDRNGSRITYQDTFSANAHLINQNDAMKQAGVVVSKPGRVEVKLFVGRLSRTIDEAQLTPLFAEFGDVIETIIIRDKASGQHKGSAFVKMASLTEADAAVRALHNTKTVDPQLGTIQVKYAIGEPERLGLSKDSAQAGIDLGKLFVGSLPKTITDVEVRRVFEPYGLVEEVVVIKDSVSGQPKGCAFVKFTYKEAAILAIRALHGQVTYPECSRPLEVKFAENRRAVNEVPQTTTATTTATTTPNQFMGYHQTNALMGGYTAGIRGAAVSNALMTNNPNSVMTQASNLNPRSVCGWTEYFTADGRAYYHHDLTKTTQWTKPVEFDRILGTAPPPPGGNPPVGGSQVTRPPGANVFVFHIPSEWGQTDIITHFSRFGRVISCYVATDRATGRNKGYGFVSYDNVQAAANAVMGMNGFLVGTKRLKVSIKTGEETYAAPYFNRNYQQTSHTPIAKDAANSNPKNYNPLGVYNLATGANRPNASSQVPLSNYRSLPY